MARILGLDLGSHSLKGVVMETTLRGSTVKEVVEAPVPQEGERPARLAQALSALLATPLRADQVVISLPGTSLATHTITLPFTEPKKIEATLGGEIEGQMPFELSEAVYDYQLAQSDEKGASLLVGVMRKAELGALLSQLQAAKLDPRIVTHPGLAAQNLLPVLPNALLPESPEDAVCVLDVGHERTTISIGRPGGSVEATRTLPGGGLLLTKALAHEFNIGLPEAQAWKEQHGAVGPEVVGVDAERAAGAFLRAFAPVLRELKSTLKAYTARAHRNVGRVILCGGTARLRGLPEQLGTDLGISTQRLELTPELAAAAGAAAGPQLAQAWALALRGVAAGAKAPRFNLRRGEFAFKSDLDYVKDRVGQLVAFGAVLLVLLVASGLVRNSVLERREKQVDAALCDVTQRILGKCEKNFDIALNLLKGKESPAAGIPKRSATTLLAEMTTRIPPEIPVTMDQIVIDMDRVTMRCEAASSKQMEEIVAALKTYKCFKEVKEGKLEKNKDGTKVTFRLDINVECPDDLTKEG